MVWGYKSPHLPQNYSVAHQSIWTGCDEFTGFVTPCWKRLHFLYICTRIFKYFLGTKMFKFSFDSSVDSYVIFRFYVKIYSEFLSEIDGLLFVICV